MAAVSESKKGTRRRPPLWAWLVALTLVVAIARVVLLYSSRPTIGTVVTVLLVVVVGIAVFLVPFSLLGRRSARRELALANMFPDALLISGYRSPGMTLTLKEFYKADRVPLYFTWVVTSSEAQLWFGGATPARSVTIRPSEIVEVRASTMRSGSSYFAALVFGYDAEFFIAHIPFSVLRPGTAAFPVNSAAVESLVGKINRLWAR